MTMYWKMSTAWTRDVQRARDLIVADLRKRVESRELDGDVTMDGFSLSPGPGIRFMRRNSWRPIAVGKFVSVGTFTRVEVTVDVNPVVRIFTVVHACLFLGLSWIMGVWAFSLELDRLRAALDRAFDGG